jgi:hypothetical protein
MSYKIKMYCTQKEQLLFNNKPITQKSGHDIIHALTPNDNIKEIFILYKDINFLKKNNKKYCIKSIEIELYDFLLEQDFILFIAKMKQAGFYSFNDTKIQYINMDDNKIWYEYRFRTIVKQTPKPRVYCRNTSTYKHLTLYKKYSNRDAITCD